MAIDRLKAMEVFARVAELGSFTQAADALSMPKPTVSVLVRDLETHLGVRLLNRTTRRLSLTPDGVAYLERANLLLREIGELETQVRGATVTPAGRLRVDVAAAFGRHVLMPALPEFLARYPEINIEVGSTDRPVDLVREGVDCVVRGGNVFDESLVAKKLGALEVITCAAPSYLATFGTPKKLSDLDRHIFVNYFSTKTGRIFPFEFKTRGRDAVMQEISRPHRVAANDADSYIAAGVAGMGLIQSPMTRFVREHLAAGRLVRVMEKFDCGQLPMVAMYPRNRHLSARIRAFVDWVAEVFAREFETPAPVRLSKQKHAMKSANRRV
jgi:LysR family transcriptional regulator, regulator for bpeEF and oprC